MTLLIKSLFGMFWIFSSSFLVFLIYIVMQTESDPQLRWAWITMTGLTFAAASLLAYIVISAGNNSSQDLSTGTNEISEPDSNTPSETENDTE